MSYISEEFMNIRGKTPGLIPTFFVPLAVLLDFLIKGELSFSILVKRCRRGKWADVLMRLRRRTLLPGLFLSNVRSLANKMDEL